MKRIFYLLIVLVILMASCKKAQDKQQQQPGNGGKGKLKEVVIPNLPSPYYSFEYNASGNISRASFASGIREYDVSYEGNKIQKMQDNKAGKNKLQYEYLDGNLTLVKVINEDGVVYRRCFINYTSTMRLRKIEWDRKEGSAGFALEQSVEFSYYDDGNLEEVVTIQYPAGTTSIDRFEDYDTKQNVDAFMFLHTENHHLLLLPEFKLQKNNARKLIRTGDVLNYTITYTYIYNVDGKPVVKEGDAIITNGPNTGEHFSTGANFSYYN